jgi:GNAT superfamily N-acetyltransferase
MDFRWNLAEIGRILEASQWDVEPSATPDGLVVVDRPDRLHWRSPVRSLYANKVVRTTFPAAEVDRSIQEIIGFYADHGLPFSWWVGPSSAPAWLEERLRTHGLSQIDRYEGVALPLEGRPAIAPNPSVTVHPVETEAEVRELVRVNAQVWGYRPEDEDRMVRERLEYLRLPDRRGGYLLARVEGQAVGTANYRYSSDGRTLYLTGASTLPAFRGRGIFTELVRWRLEEAVRKGCQLATCLARAGTSAPILTKLGFVPVITIPVYAWQPPHA